MKTIFTFLFLILLILPSKFQAQNTENDTSRETNKVFISVPVIVMDKEGHYIPGLKKEDFTVYQDGINQQITFFSTFNEPFKVSLMLDTSSSTRKVISKIKSAAKNFVDSLNPNDQCQVTTFDSQLKIVTPFTSDKRVIKNSLDKVEINEYGGTIMYSAVDQIIQKSFNDVKGRNVIILLTDGDDFGSSITKDELLKLLEELDISIYTIFFDTGKNYSKSVNADGNLKKGKRSKKTRKNKKENQNINSASKVYVMSEEEIELNEKNNEIKAINSLKSMSDITVGRFYRSDVRDLDKVFKNIIGELTQQYRLGYNSNDDLRNKATRDISVKAKRANVVIRTRGAISTRRR